MTMREKLRRMKRQMLREDKQCRRSWRHTHKPENCCCMAHTGRRIAARVLQKFAEEEGGR